VLYPAQRQFLEAAFSNGAIPPELLYGAIKKSGKTTFAGAIVLYVVRVLAGPFGEAYTVANDLEQSTGRVFRAIARIVKANPWLGRARVLKNVIEFPRAGATITALASDYASAAGTNAHIVVFDELWAHTSERSRRLWDELVPVPTRSPSIRLTTTYSPRDRSSRGTPSRAQSRFPSCSSFWTRPDTQSESPAPGRRRRRRAANQWRVAFVSSDLQDRYAQDTGSPGQHRAWNVIGFVNGRSR
jgi:hypothetical protein